MRFPPGLSSSIFFGATPHTCAQVVLVCLLPPPPPLLSDPDRTDACEDGEEREVGSVVRLPAMVVFVHGPGGSSLEMRDESKRKRRSVIFY